MASDDEFNVSELTEDTGNHESHPVPRNERKRSAASVEDETAKLKRGNTDLWAHTRSPKDEEPLRNKHKHEIYSIQLITRVILARIGTIRGNILKQQSRLHGSYGRSTASHEAKNSRQLPKVQISDR
jgi:hypothetical protein